jgi:two-component system, OmpR family, phosphate regulon sensor histidine kinase PhoR
MSENTGFFRKVCLFIFLIATPSIVFSVWLFSQDILDNKSFIALLVLIVFPSIFVFIKLTREIREISKKVEAAAESGLQVERLGVAQYSSLLPTDNLVLAMQQYHRILKKMLEESQEAQRETAHFFDMLPDPVLILDQKRRIIRSNSAANIFFNTEDMTGDLTGYLRHPALLKAVDAAYKGQVTGQGIEITRTDAVTQYLAAYVVSLQSDDARDLRLSVTLHDMTASRKLEQMRVDFVANASHELRTPLAILIGALETLMGPARNDLKAHQRFFDMMEKQTARMSQLTDDLLSLSQIEINEHTRPAAPVNISKIVCSAKNMIQLKAEELEKEIKLELPEKETIVAGDSGQLSQVFTNLLDNALKYSREKAEVIVRVTDSEKNIQVSIMDFGEGIDPGHIPRLTERFYRVDGDRSRELGGTGLGLAIVKHIVSRHRGTLEIESEQGIGSTFTVNLPKFIQK